MNQSKRCGFAGNMIGSLCQLYTEFSYYIYARRGNGETPNNSGALITEARR
jgi:hypothetical protein